MFKSVLIAEDHESANISIRKSLIDLGVSHTDYVYYCDDALQRLKMAMQLNQPFDLLVTDLYFEEDHHQQLLNGGEALIAAARAIQPGLKILVFSAEARAAMIDKLFEELAINGFVRKARHDVQELKTAMHSIFNGKRHFPAHLRQAVKQKNAYEFSAFDLTIISLLAEGMLQKEIPAYLQKNDIKPSGLSSLEKRLNHMKEMLEFSKNEQLVAFCKDMGII